MNRIPEKPVRILAIAPYEGLMASLIRTAEAFPHIHLEAYTADLEEGVRIIKQLNTDNYDAIISRGGTADMIRTASNLPVVEIPVSVYDVLRVIKLSESFTEKFAIVGFPGITKNAHTLCNLLRLDVPIKTVYDAGGVTEALNDIKKDGIHTVICDNVTQQYARLDNFNALLITSGENSLQQALQEAEVQGGSFRQIRTENLFFRKMLCQDSRQSAVFDEAQNLVFSVPDDLSDPLLSIMRRRIANVSDKEESLFYHQVGNTLHIMTASLFYVQKQKYVLFRDQPKHIPLRSAHSGIRFHDLAECEHLYRNSFYSLSSFMGEAAERLEPIAAAERPVLIIGEPGTGKGQAARALYLRSRFRNHPFVTVDSAQLKNRSWSFLLEHHASPLSTSGTVVCFRHMESAPLQRQQELFSLIEETRLSRRLWLIFSCDEQEEGSFSEFSQELSKRLGPITLHMRSLRSRKDELPVLASLYLDRINTELGKQVSGFEPNAMEMLIRYDWPGNYTQFKHVLRELSVLTTGHYISGVDVAELLAKERRMNRGSAGALTASSFSGQTLDQITQSIVRQMLAANHGNQSVTAQQLGISRTTLWRMLSRGDP